jgi:hypothetical protein
MHHQIGNDSRNRAFHVRWTFQKEALMDMARNRCSKIHLTVLMGRFADQDDGHEWTAMENLTFECRHASKQAACS